MLHCLGAPALELSQITQFADSKFLSGQSKEKIMKAWIRFLKSGFSYHNFTNDLYNHLHLHCGFIAHFNRRGFFETYFEDPESTIKFLRQFDEDFDFRGVECGTNWWYKGEYEDLNFALVAEFKQLKAQICKTLNQQRLQNKQAEVERNQTELAVLQQLNR